MANKYLVLAQTVLEKAERRLSRTEIWNKAQNMGMIEELGPKATRRALAASLYGDEANNQPTSLFDSVGRQPKRFGLKSKVYPTVDPGDPVPKPAPTISYMEKDLHPLLACYVASPNFLDERKIYTKTIAHEKSGKGLNEWLHPDMVGVYFPFEDLQPKVVEASKLLGSNSLVRLFSFELKRHIDRGNYRECFFQAVSNSSWAHEGYLVAADISEDEELRNELERLSKSFGIGIIHLNVKDFYASAVLYPAKPAERLDWETIDKLTGVNKDFSDFIDRLNKDFKSGEVHPLKYDDISVDPVEYIRKKLKVDTVE